MGMASSAACECGAEKQTVDRVVLPCPIHRPPHGLHGLTVLDDGCCLIGMKHEVASDISVRISAYFLCRGSNAAGQCKNVLVAF